MGRHASGEVGVCNYCHTQLTYVGGKWRLGRPRTIWVGGEHIESPTRITYHDCYCMTEDERRLHNHDGLSLDEVRVIAAREHIVETDDDVLLLLRLAGKLR